ncbi:uncharacterized protein L201_001390 [Kwoniella dendrophila CBS 6074]|uniref:PIR Superfamily Protein n=1 Tax=Kwoniella dendrophila CBS 6074 TaxID=1295534 RepID=A0AAX4JNR5_9TREE
MTPKAYEVAGNSTTPSYPEIKEIFDSVTMNKRWDTLDNDKQKVLVKQCDKLCNLIAETKIDIHKMINSNGDSENEGHTCTNPNSCFESIRNEIEFSTVVSGQNSDNNIRIDPILWRVLGTQENRKNLHYDISHSDQVKKQVNSIIRYYSKIIYDELSKESSKSRDEVENLNLFKEYIKCMSNLQYTINIYPYSGSIGYGIYSPDMDNLISENESKNKNSINNNANNSKTRRNRYFDNDSILEEKLINSSFRWGGSFTEPINITEFITHDQLSRMKEIQKNNVYLYYLRNSLEIFKLI